MKLNAAELRDAQEALAKKATESVSRKPLYLILENVYDTYNIGGLFRLADALAVEKMYLCGDMEIPPNHRIAKASIGTYKIVPWEYKDSASDAMQELRSRKSKVESLKSDVQIVAVEQSSKSVPYTEITYTFPTAIIVGNETFGVLPETMALADHIAEIPMWGVNKSLNVIVSAAIVGYHILNSRE